MAVLAGSTGKRDLFPVEIGQAFSLEVRTNDQISAKVVLLGYGDHQGLQLRMPEPGPGELDAVKDAELDFVVDQILAQVGVLAVGDDLAGEAGLLLHERSEGLHHNDQ